MLRWKTTSAAAVVLLAQRPTTDSNKTVAERRLRLLLREVFTAAGGTHDDWDAYDRVMREERRTAVLVTPTRVYGNS